MPPPPDDVSLHGVSTVPLEHHRYGIAVVARVDGGPPLRLQVDTGSSFTLSPEAARRAHLRLIGNGKVGGVGPRVVAERYATVRRLQIGGAVLRNQPVEVFRFDEGSAGKRPDGMIGYEVIARFALSFSVRVPVPVKCAWAMSGASVELRFCQSSPVHVNHAFLS